ncbi:MAG: helix-turn-helix transcriptional regulator [Lentisphaeria bacterium]|nr:MAG: helix-turn-helix transcriptional regulator [Lentisphaeria bacterium]
MVLANALKLLTLICRDAKRNTAAEPGDAVYKINRIVSELNSAFAEEWTLQSMAEASGFSVGCFRQQFRRIVGDSPIAWLLSLRLEKAAHLLRSTSLPVADIAEVCGFRDSNYFSRQFRRKFGCSPRTFRQRAAQ